MRRLDALSNNVLRSTLAFDVDMFALVTDYEKKNENDERRNAEWW